MLTFLSDLTQNNNREWFSENKETFEKNKNQAQQVFEAIHEDMQSLDMIEPLKIFRIYRDVRFSKDKSPYKTHFSMFFGRQKPEYRGGYYLHIQPGASFVGGGFWEPNKEDLFRMRKEIMMEDDAFLEIINNKEFKKYFGELKGEALKTAPKDFAKDHPMINYIKKKQFLLMRPLSDKEVLSPGFKQEVIVSYKAMRPFMDYMTFALTTNLNGESVL